MLRPPRSSAAPGIALLPLGGVGGVARDHLPLPPPLGLSLHVWRPDNAEEGYKDVVAESDKASSPARLRLLFGIRAAASPALTPHQPHRADAASASGQERGTG
eukprot:346420-Rhodomonas_salina.3